METARVREKIKEEFLAVLPPTLFFFVALHIVAFIRVLMAKAHGIHACPSQKPDPHDNH